MKPAIKKYFFFNFILLLLCNSVVGKSENENREIDSLLNLIKNSNPDTNRVKHFLALGNQYFYNTPDSAFAYFQKALDLSSKLKVNKFIARCYNITGNLNSQQGNFDKAMDCYLKAVKIYETLKDRKKVAMCYNNVGLVQSEQGEFGKAIEYYLKALKIFEEIKDKKGTSLIYNNIGIVYWNKKIYNYALEFYQKSLKIDIELGNIKGMADGYNNIGLLYSEQLNDKKAIDFYFKALKLYEEYGDLYGIAGVYQNISALYVIQKQYEKGVLFSLKGLKIAENIGSLPMQKLAYENLSKANDSLRNYKKAFEYLKKQSTFKDSIYNIESSKQIKTLDARYQNEKKEKEIALLNKDKELQNIEVQRQKMQIYGLILGFALMLALAFVSYRSFRQKKKANIALAEQKFIIEEKNVELSQQNEEISAQRDEIEAQRDIVTSQKNHVEEIHSKLTASIRYAERIQHAVLPSEELFKMLLANYFILYKPKDVVSGDFYWTTIKKNKLLVAIADCTGHGVPGAFMSMLGISFLNEITAQSEFISTSNILNLLRDYIIKSLQQQGISGEQKDGMDISLIAIDLETYNLQFSGANNPIYIVKCLKPKEQNVGSNFEHTNSKLYELKGDKMPVAIHITMDDFSNQEMQLHEGDTIYLFTDGYADQFGGNKGKKFMYSKFKELLVSISDIPMDNQKIILDNNIYNWMNDSDIKYEQTDDITVLGIKI